VSATELDEFLSGLAEDILVVMDEAYIDYVNAPDFPDAFALRRRRNTVVTLRTFSKFHSIAGVRVGYAVADPAVVAALHRTRQPFNVSLLAQAAGMAALECGEELRPMAEETIRERERLRAEVRKLGMECPESQTNFIFVDLGESDLNLFEALAKRNVIVRPMGQFGSSKNTYRISVGTPEENDIFLEALRAACGARTA
jgi:histidinol-phosphate aminotransferase